MALSPKLEIRQGQSLIMTPQLMQAIKLLQMSNLDLVAYVEAELERNPLLEKNEIAEGGGEGALRILDTRTVSTVTDGAASTVTPNASESAGALVLFSWAAAAPTVPPVSMSTARARTLALNTSSCKVHVGG